MSCDGACAATTVAAPHTDAAPYQEKARVNRSLFSGWLYARSAADIQCWQRRWCVLEALAALTLYEDDHCQRRAARVALTSRTRALAFSHAAAPAEAVRCLEQRPWGFLLDPDPADDAGELRPLFFFDPAPAPRASSLEGALGTAGAAAERDEEHQGCLSSLAPLGQGSEVVAAGCVEGDASAEAALEAWLRAIGDAAASLEAAAGAAVGLSLGSKVDDAIVEGKVADCHSPEVDGAINIDDYSDYEDDAHFRRSSLVDHHEMNWTLPGQPSIRSRSPPSPLMASAQPPHLHGADAAHAVGQSFDIDDFSDYEDDRHARSSSLVSLDRHDWTALGSRQRPRLPTDREEHLGTPAATGPVAVPEDAPAPEPELF